MNTYSVVLRLRRRLTEEVHVPVLVTDDLMREDPEPGGSTRMDTQKLFAEAVRMGREEVLAWRAEEPPAVEVHPLQTPPALPVPQPPEALALRWLDCFASQDLDGLLGLYRDDAIHTSPKIRALHPDTGGVLSGKPAMRAWWSDAFKRLPSLRYDLTALTTDRTRVFMEYVRRTPGEPDLPVAEVLELAPDGRIAASRVYHG